MITSTAWYNPNEIKFCTKFSSIHLARWEKRLVFRLSFVHLQRAKDGTHILMQNIDMWLLYKSHQIARLVSHLINHFSKWMFTVEHKKATKFDNRNEILHIFLYHWVTSYGYIIVDSCKISFNLNCIMQLKQFYNIVTKVSSRKKCYYFWWSTWLVTVEHFGFM